ncbi:hypothetical protein PGT21_015720 [Puccinia graminis f. sp. tritici]|uniref:AN1-type domain-containing protein n=2 Tax=Puccinia graminis f. sp. tritici TaxID=56615 RepID=E3KP07_PUCGT|nr:uncharacterized protein PGTG_11988 [Puccinia graminis f. sp. tritici CRL 75-36-700-3]EFP86032.1 hypothetical protein PGTG_11988 [Puccinia graminis f. sp. tritici CRL 75-36-700-3]KAA1101289.1 hypothetical protein PGT21_015720 [Puccinia graminis f. sp. tritici]
MNTTPTVESPATSNKQHQLEEWGAHCSLPSCNLLDFLPLKCPECHKTFCSSHYKPSLVSSDLDHLCEPLVLKTKEKENLPKPTRIPNSLGANQTKKCSYIKCKTLMLAPISCPHCQLTYCPSHRLEQDHLCQSFTSSSSSSSGNGTKNPGKNSNYADLLKNYLSNPVDSQSLKSSNPHHHPPSTSSSASKTSSLDPHHSSTDPNNPFSLKQHLSKIKSSQRSKAELQSQQKALEFRIKNQLLTEKDKQEIHRLNEEKRQKQTLKASSGPNPKAPPSSTSSSNDCCIV